MISQFVFDKDLARKFIDSFHSEMARGLNKEQSSLKMLSSFVKRPLGSEKGNFLALDLGGTNFRVMLVNLSGNRTFHTVAQSSYSLTMDLITGDGNLLFNFIACSLGSFLKKNGILGADRYSLGFTFSFPVMQTSIREGRLIMWTKGFSAGGVVGKDVVKLLENALKVEGINSVSVDALVNDTVGTLMTKSYQKTDCDMGVILGTGTNACYPENNRSDGVIINTEWGAFDKFVRTSYDKMLDDASGNKGHQLFEKAVSGMYIGEVFRLVLCDMVKNRDLFPFIEDLSLHPLSKQYSISGEQMSLMAKDGFDMERIDLKAASVKDLSTVKLVADIVSTRSARLAASAVSAILLWLDDTLKHEHVVAIDGSLYEKYPDYSEKMHSFMKDILGANSQRVKFSLSKDGSGIGATIIAAVTARR